MKRILSIFLAALFCISASLAAVTGVTAGEAADPDDNLVLHYDFEGATVEEKLKDKAPMSNGRVADNLTLKNGGTADADGNYAGIDFSNGYVQQKASTTINNGSRAFLEQTTAATTDMEAALEGSMTFTARFRMGEEINSYTTSNDTDSSTKAEGYSYIFDARVMKAAAQAADASRAFNVMYRVDQKRVNISFATADAPNSDKVWGFDFSSYDFETSPWINLVVTIDVNESNELTVWAYYTLGDPDGTQTWQKSQNKSANGNTNGRVELKGNKAKTFSSKTPTGLCIDDIKLYDRVLTADEINSVTKVNAVRYGGFQDSAAYGETGSQKFDVRFVSTVNALDYRGVGMEVTRPDGTGTKTYTSTNTKTVYESLLGKTSANTPLRQVAASEFDAKYLFCLTVTGVPTGEDVVFTVKPFAILADGTKEYGDAYTVTFNADGTHKTAKIY